MKTKELIKLLQKADPTGETDVVIGKNNPILFIETLPGYYDGCFYRLIKDENNKDSYNVIGAKAISGGYKICLHKLSLEDMLLNVDDGEFELDITEATSAQKSFIHRRINRYYEEESDPSLRELIKIKE